MHVCDHHYWRGLSFIHMYISRLCVGVVPLCVCCMQVHYARVVRKIHVCNKLFNEID